MKSSVTCLTLVFKTVKISGTVEKCTSVRRKSKYICSLQTGEESTASSSWPAFRLGNSVSCKRNPTARQTERENINAACLIMTCNWQQQRNNTVCCSETQPVLYSQHSIISVSRLISVFHRKRIAAVRSLTSRVERFVPFALLSV